MPIETCEYRMTGDERWKCECIIEKGPLYDEWMTKCMKSWNNVKIVKLIKKYKLKPKYKLTLILNICVFTIIWRDAFKNCI